MSRKAIVQPFTDEFPVRSLCHGTSVGRSVLHLNDQRHKLWKAVVTYDWLVPLLLLHRQVRREKPVLQSKRHQRRAEV